MAILTQPLTWHTPLCNGFYTFVFVSSDEEGQHSPWKHKQNNFSAVEGYACQQNLV